MRKYLIKWLQIYETQQATEDRLNRRIKDLEKEVRQCMEFIGALYDYLGVRPQRTFIEDYSRLPSEQQPTREIIKAERVKKKLPPTS